MFLVGLNKRLDEVRGRIMGKIPLPSLLETFSEVKREEARQDVMMGKSPSVVEVESSALVTKNEEEKRYGKKPWYEHCKRPSHIRDTCLKLHRKPPNWKKRKENEGRSLQAGTSEQEKHQLYKLLESQTPFCSIVQRGPPEMPQHKDSDKETDNRFTTSDLTWKGNVFERRNHKERIEGPILRLFQDSEPIDNSTHLPNTAVCRRNFKK
ncbi:uncharacterized protein [Cicer arietinum]|uniref:uncharacterized protein n=1 Tax=Cicer arietinum TaxID=3827 RepID=UPI003CC6BF9A